MVKTETLLVGGAVVVGGYFLLRNASGIGAATGSIGNTLQRVTAGNQDRGEIRQEERTERTQTTQEGRTNRNEIRQTARTERTETRQEARTENTGTRADASVERTKSRQVFVTDAQGTVINVLSVPLDVWDRGANFVKSYFGVLQGEVNVANGCFRGDYYVNGVAVRECAEDERKPYFDAVVDEVKNVFTGARRRRNPPPPQSPTPTVTVQPEPNPRGPYLDAFRRKYPEPPTVTVQPEPQPEPEPEGRPNIISGIINAIRPPRIFRGIFG